MNSIFFQEFLGWCTVINLGFLVFIALILVVFQKVMVQAHSKMMNIDEKQLPAIYFNYLGKYKIAILILNFVPYIALKIISQ